MESFPQRRVIFLEGKGNRNLGDWNMAKEERDHWSGMERILPPLVLICSYAR